MIRISKATARDVPALARLLRKLFEQESEFSPDQELQRRALLMIVRDPQRGVILVMKDGTVVIGMVNLLFTVSTAEGGPVAILEDLILESSYRGTGLGSRLIGHAIRLAARNGISRVTLLTDRANCGAIKFYRRHGFSESSMIPFRLQLRKGSGT